MTIKKIQAHLKEDMTEFYNTSEAYLDHLKTEKNSEHFNWSGYVKFATRYLKDGEKVLELGCGVGTAAVMLKRTKNINLTATDLSEKFIKFAKARKDGKGIRFEVQDSTRLTYKDNTFDVVSSMGMLEHVPTPMKSLDEMVRVIKPGGKLIVVFPNWFSLFKIVKSIFNFTCKGYFTKSRLHMVAWFFTAAYYLVQKQFSPKPVFRKPNLRLKRDKLENYHNDEDMVYIAHPSEVKKYLESKGCKVISLAADTYRMSFIPAIAPYGGIVAIKKTAE
jgi:2-polyprenyl-3-methyl-5-hydroxy-6-metoxy-1,4-benzoquinol methylase